MHRAVVAAAAAGLFFLGAPAPAAPPEPPATFIKVDELKELLDSGALTPQEFDAAKQKLLSTS